MGWACEYERAPAAAPQCRAPSQQTPPRCAERADDRAGTPQGHPPATTTSALNGSAQNGGPPPRHPSTFASLPAPARRLGFRL